VHSIDRYFIIFTAAFYLLALPYAHGNTNTTENVSIETKSFETRSNTFYIFPRIGMQIEGRTFAENDARYKMETHRIFDLDIFKINNIAFSMNVNEFIIFNNRSRYINPKTINYEMDFGSLSWENKYGILSLFADHNCTNIINENETSDRQARWYGYGIRWESFGMKPGQKNKNIDFQNPDNIYLIDNFSYRISAERKIHIKVYDFDYMIIGALRYDILNYYFIIPYIEGSFTSLINGHVRFNRYFETGLRMHFDKGDITPFIGTNYKYDIDSYYAKATDLYYIGLRMETLFENDTDIKKSKLKAPSNGTSSFPDFHFKGSYGKYINNDNLNFNTDISFGLDFLSTYKLSPFIYDTVTHNSLKANAGMFPRYIKQNIEAGVSCKLDFIDALIEPYYRYFRSDDGNYNKGYTERFSTAGLRFISRKMKTGFANSGLDFDKSQNLESINTIDWSVSAERVLYKRYYDYIWECNILLRWNIFRYEKSIPYIAAGVCFLLDRNYDKAYNAETGVRIQGGLQWILFYRYEYRTAIDPENGLFRNFNLIGIRFEI
jgi:hypothetical protein